MTALRKSVLVFVGFVLGLALLNGCGNDGEARSDEKKVDQSTSDEGIALQEGMAVVRTRSDDWRKLDDPAQDGWDTEVLSDHLKKQLGTLAELLSGGKLAAADLQKVTAEKAVSSNLVPTGVDVVYEKDGLRVQRGVSVDSANTPLIEALGTLQGKMGEGATRWKFKVVGIEVKGEKAVSRQLLEAARKSEGGYAEIHSDWHIEWALKDGEARIAEVRLIDFEHSEAKERFFEDCTESILGECESYRSQLLYGATHWLPRIQDTRQMTLLGTPGTAVGDVNGDGLDDLYLCQPGGLPNLLYVQNPDGTLRDVSMASGTAWLESARSALLVDLDNDGDQDLAVASFARLVLARNDGAGRFEIAAMLETGIGAMGLSAADFDEDGDLDLYLCHYSAGDLEVEAGATVIGTGEQFVYHDANNGGRNRLFRNEGGTSDGPWTFVDVTAEVGLDANNRRFTLAAAWEDYDNDGDLDLYVANDFGRNNLYRNEGGRFVDVAGAMQGEDQASGMSVSWGDVNRDGRMDLYVGNMFSAAGRRITPQSGFGEGVSGNVRKALKRFARGNTMLLQSLDGFRDVSEPMGVTMGRWAWSSLFADINNDGWEDVLIANGYITTPDTGDL